MEINDHHVASDALNRQRMRSRARQHFGRGLNSAAAIALMLTLAVMLNYLSARHYVRMDWSQARFYELSGKTVALLNSLAEPVRVTVLVQPGHEIYQFMHEDSLRLLREYEHGARGRITVERVDPDRHLGRTEALMNQFALDRVNVIIMEMGEQFRVIPADEVMEMDYRPLLEGGPPQKSAFRGEQVFSSALFSLAERQPPRVYFLQGQGERDFHDRDEYVGLSRIAQSIQRDHIELVPFTFQQRTTLPEDAAALIIAAPSRTYSAQQVDRIRHFVRRTGRLMLMLNTETDAGFGGLLGEWGIEAFDNLLVDPARSLSGFDVLTSGYADHPITERLHGTTTVFYWPRALPLRADTDGGDAAPDQPRPTALAFSSPQSWAERDPGRRPHRFDAERDVRGPLPMAVAVERGPGIRTAVNVRPHRVVVFGDVDFISNSGISGGNADLFMNALNWILERDQLLDIAPKPVEQVKLLINRRQLRQLFWTVVVGVPAAAALTGVWVRWRRRR